MNICAQLHITTSGGREWGGREGIGGGRRNEKLFDPHKLSIRYKCGKRGDKMKWHRQIKNPDIYKYTRMCITME